MSFVNSNTDSKRTAKVAALLTASTAAVYALTLGLHWTSSHSNASKNPTESSFRKRELFEDKADITSLVQEPYVVNAIDTFDESDGDDDDHVLPAAKTAEGDQYQVTNIALIGERHSGTNWITDHLQDCFGEDILVSSNIFCTSFSEDATNINFGLSANNIIITLTQAYDACSHS